MSGDKSKSGFRLDIQGLRGIAVVFVLLFHVGISYIPGGYVGVDIFFVISGYLITGLLCREVYKTGSIDFVQFYGRRLRRLLPALTLVLICTTAVAWWAYAPLQLKQYASSGVATAAYVSNLWFADLATDYLADSVDMNPLLHTWSLGVEEQFYLVWPLLVFIVFRLRRPSAFRRGLLVAMLAVGGLSLLACVYLTKVSQPWAFFGSPTRAWEFAIGAVLALWAPRRPSVAGIVPIFGFGGLLMMLAAGMVFTKRTDFPGFAAALPVLGSAAVIQAGAWAESAGIGRWLSRQPLRFLGDISYSLYLWHWPIFVFLHEFVTDVGPLETTGALGLSVLLAWLTYVGVENPVRFNRLLRRGRWLSVAFGAGLTAFSGVATFSVWLSTLVWLERDKQQQYALAKDDLPEAYKTGCAVGTRGIVPRVCRMGAAEPTMTVVLFGDSHAMQWLPALRALEDFDKIQVIPLSKASCPAASYGVYLTMLNRYYDECDKWRERVFQIIRDLQPDVVIVSNVRPDKMSSSSVTAPMLKKWENALEVTFDRLSKMTKSIVYIRDTPRLGYDGPTCLSRADWVDADPVVACPIDPRSKNAKLIFQSEMVVAARFDKVQVVDMTDDICPDTPCLPERDGMVLFRDSHHLTASFVRYLAPALWRQMQPALDRAELGARN